MKVIYWDIDGTLLATARAGLKAFQEATEQVFACQPDLKGITAAGMTDFYIASEIIFKVLGTKPTDDQVITLIKRYEELLPLHLATTKGYTIPYVREVLSYLHNHPEYISLLLTGNTAAGAKAKLAQFSLDGFFDFSLSAFGDLCQDRLGVASQALAHIQARFPEIRQNQLFVIGDTPNDIRCGKEIGAWTVAVATGTYTLEELQNHSPWWLTKYLPTPPEFAKKLATVN